MSERLDADDRSPHVLETLRRDSKASVREFLPRSPSSQLDQRREADETVCASIHHAGIDFESASRPAGALPRFVIAVGSDVG